MYGWNNWPYVVAWENVLYLVEFLYYVEYLFLNLIPGLCVLFCILNPLFCPIKLVQLIIHLYAYWTFFPVHHQLCFSVNAIVDRFRSSSDLFTRSRPTASAIEVDLFRFVIQTTIKNRKTQMANSQGTFAYQKGNNFLEVFVKYLYSQDHHLVLADICQSFTCILLACRNRTGTGCRWGREWHGCLRDQLWWRLQWTGHRIEERGERRKDHSERVRSVRLCVHACVHAWQTTGSCCNPF